MKKRSNMFERYEQQMKLKEIGREGQEALQRASVAMIGIGGLGSPLSLYLSGSGIGRLLLVDGDTVSISNLHRQILFKEEDIGKSKAFVAKRRLLEQNSTIQIEGRDMAITDQNVHEILSSYDIIVDGTDNFKTKFLLNRYCKENNKIFVYGSVDRWMGQVALFHPKGPCL